MHENKIFSGGGFNKEKFCDMLNPESVLSKIFRKEDDCRMVTDNELIKSGFEAFKLIVMTILGYMFGSNSSQSD